MPNVTYPITLRNATPETTPLGELAKLIEKLDVAIIETARDRNIELPEDEAVVSLVNIEKGSNRLVFTLAHFMWPILAELTHSIEEGDFVALPSKAHNALYDISRQAKKQHWDVLFPEQQGHKNQDQMYHIQKTEISTQRPITPPKPQFIKGTTTIFGMCVRVGGKHLRWIYHWPIAIGCSTVKRPERLQFVCRAASIKMSLYMGKLCGIPTPGTWSSSKLQRSPISPPAGGTSRDATRRRSSRRRSRGPSTRRSWRRGR